MSNVMTMREDGRSMLPCTSFLNEEEIQEIVKATPEIINLDTIFGEPMMVIGRENERIDVLGITASMVPVIVECKRRNNPDMRYLIAQVFEYAARLSKMSFNDFDALAMKYFQSVRCHDPRLRTMNLHVAFSDFLTKHGQSESPDSSDFRELLAENLRDGEFYLIVVVDEISEVARETIEFLNRKMQKLRIAIVEIKKYESGHTKVFVADHVNNSTSSDITKPGRTTFAEMLQACGQREALLIQEFKRTWELNSDWTISMGYKGFSAQYKQTSIIWVLPEYVQLAPRLKDADRFLEIVKRYLPEGQKRRSLNAPGFDLPAMKRMIKEIQEAARMTYGG